MSGDDAVDLLERTPDPALLDRFERSLKLRVRSVYLGIDMAGELANPMDALTWFGLFAVSAMLVCYALEERSHWFIFGFAAACGPGSIYGFLQGAWPFGVIEAIWLLVALRRWWARKSKLSLTVSK